MRWIREHKVITALVGVVVVIVVLGASMSGGNTLIGRGLHKFITVIEKPFTYVAGGIQDGVDGIFNYKSLQEENEKLKEENQQLKQSNINLALTREEYNDLQELAVAFDFEPFKGVEKAVVGNIVSLDNSMIYREFTIDIGQNKGVVKGDIVVDGNGLVGVVKEVSATTSKISSILDTDKNIGFMVKRDLNTLGILKGDGTTKLGGYLLDENANVVEGDTLITSGMGHYPKGIVVGKVSKVEYDSDTQLKRIEVKPSFSFKSMQKVAIFK